MIIQDCPHISCAVPLYSGSCLTRCIERYNRLMGNPSVGKIVRCADCKHFTEGMAIGMCKRDPEKPLFPMEWDNFCKYGERREENDR